LAARVIFRTFGSLLNYFSFAGYQEGTTALMLATCKDSEEVAILLLNAGADIAQKDKVISTS
jgi:hypothetical protein